MTDFSLYHNGQRKASAPVPFDLFLLMELAGYEGGVLKYRGEVVFDDSTDNPGGRKWRMTTEFRELAIERMKKVEIDYQVKRRRR